MKVLLLLAALLTSQVYATLTPAGSSTGTGIVKVLQTSPALITPDLGAAVVQVTYS